MSFKSSKEKKDAVLRRVSELLAQGCQKTSAVRQVAEEFCYCSELSVWNILKKEAKNGNRET